MWQRKGKKYHFIMSDPLTRNGVVFESCCGLFIAVEHKDQDEYPLSNKCPICTSVRHITGPSIGDGLFYISKQRNLNVLRLALGFENTWGKRGSLQKALAMRIRKLENAQGGEGLQ
jgi:hypothetical protein